ncbi:MAG: hypothetical protein PHH55_02470 [Candidatus Delongbacteria bacterium]|nr:hypothetical protein [Candidatus Delongbacteria bacterium]
MEKQLKQTLSRVAGLYEKDRKYFAFYSDILYQTGDKARAKKVLKDNINSYPDYTTGELVLGEILFNESKLDQAEMLFKGAVKKDPACVKAYKFLSEIEDKRGNSHDRMEALKSVAVLDPLDPDAKNIIMMSGSEFSFAGGGSSADEEVVKEEVVQDQINEDYFVPPQVSDQENEKSDEDVLHKLDSSADIEIPEFGFEEKDDVIKKHNISKEVLDMEKSFSEDIIESLDGLTQSFIEERDSFTAFVDERKELFEEKLPEETVTDDKTVEIAVDKEDESAKDADKTAEFRKNDLNLEYKDTDPKIETLLSDLVLAPESYKEKMENLSKVVDEDPENYDNLVDFAHARYKFAASTVKREIQYYSKKVNEEPRNTKYIQNLKSYRDEILKLDSDLKEELNVLKNEYY